MVENGFNEGEQLILLNSFDKIYDILKSRHASIDLVVLNDQQFTYQSAKDNSLAELSAVLKIPTVQPALYFACNKNVDALILQKLQEAFKYTL